MLGSIAALPAFTAAEDSMLTSFLTKLGQFRGPIATNVEFNGKTWGDLSFLERVKVYDWTTEIYVLLTFAVFLGFYYIGRSVNDRKVNKFYDAVKPVLQENFGYVGTSPRAEIIKDSNTRFTTYASGRANIESLLARFRLTDRQNFMNYTLGFVMPSLATPDGRPEHIEITLTPTDPNSIEPGIFAIANKESLEEAQSENFFFELTKPTDSDRLPSPTYIFLNEHNDQIDLLFSPQLKESLALEGADKVFKWIVFSDMPSTAPKTEAAVSGSKCLKLCFNFPNTAGEYEASRQILDAALNLVDVLVSKPAYRGSTLKKIKANRDEQVAKIRKNAEQLKKEELELKKAEERREAARRERNLSEKEQRKLQKKEQDKQARKQRQKMTRK